MRTSISILNEQIGDDRGEGGPWRTLEKNQSENGARPLRGDSGYKSWQYTDVEDIFYFISVFNIGLNTLKPKSCKNK